MPWSSRVGPGNWGGPPGPGAVGHNGPDGRRERVPQFAIPGPPAGGEHGSGPDRRRAAGRAPFRLGNRPPLTGIRALGITAVLIFHSNFHDPARGLGGPRGVLHPVGFLITAMLAGEHQRTGGHQPVKTSMSGEAVRLLPPLALAIALLGLYVPCVPMSMTPRTAVWGDSAAALFYSPTTARPSATSRPWLSGQCWSLSVEEQFYLFWAIVMFSWLAMGHRRLAYVLATIGVLVCTANRLWIVLSAPHSTTPSCRPGSTTPSTPGPTPCSSAVCSASWPPEASSRPGAEGHLGADDLGRGCAGVMVWILFTWTWAPVRPLWWLPSANWPRR